MYDNLGFVCLTFIRVILHSREATNKYRNYKIRIVADDTCSVRLKALSAGPQRKNMYETHCTGVWYCKRTTCIYRNYVPRECMSVHTI